MSTIAVTGDALYARLAAAADDDMFLTAELGELLHVDPHTVRRWAAAGRIPGAVKTAGGGQWRVPASVIRRILAGGTP